MYDTVEGGIMLGGDGGGRDWACMAGNTVGEMFEGGLAGDDAWDGEIGWEGTAVDDEGAGNRRVCQADMEGKWDGWMDWWTVFMRMI